MAKAEIDIGISKRSRDLFKSIAEAIKKYESYSVPVGVCKHAKDGSTACSNPYYNKDKPQLFCPDLLDISDYYENIYAVPKGELGKDWHIFDGTVCMDDDIIFINDDIFKMKHESVGTLRIFHK